MNFEEGKTYQYTGPAPGEVPQDGLPHRCLKAVTEGSVCHASFDSDISEALLTPYTEEQRIDFKEMPAASDNERLRVEGFWLPCEEKPGEIFGIGFMDLSIKTGRTLMRGLGGSGETAIVNALKEGILESKDLAALAYLGLMSAHGAGR